MSWMPGTAVATMSRAPAGHQPLGDPAHAGVLQVLDQGLVGRERPGPHGGVPGRPDRPRPGSPPRRRTAAQPNIEARPDLPSTSMMSDESPSRAAARARVAETVVLPTPPLPATMTRRDAAKNCAGSTPVPLTVGFSEALALRRLPTLASPSPRCPGLGRLARRLAARPDAGPAGAAPAVRAQAPTPVG